MIHRDIYELAKQAGACKEKGLSIIKQTTTVHGLIDLLKSPQGREFCMKHGFPSVEILSAFREELQDNGVYIDGIRELINPRLVIAFGGQIHIRSSGFNVCEVYATNNTVIKIDATEYSFTSVEQHGESEVFATEFLNGIVKVFDKRRSK